jgi:hypothetical protein
MAASSKLMMEAERRFPVRIRIGVPPEGLGSRLDQMRAWLDGNCGADGWALTPSGMRGVLNDALSIYFVDATLASAFVARWSAGYRVEAAEGVFRERDDEPTPRIGATMHRTPRPVETRRLFTMDEAMTGIEEPQAANWPN